MLPSWSALNQVNAPYWCSMPSALSFSQLLSYTRNLYGLPPSLMSLSLSRRVFTSQYEPSVRTVGKPEGSMSSHTRNGAFVHFLVYSSS